jgi:hypothetical protein
MIPLGLDSAHLNNQQCEAYMVGQQLPEWTPLQAKSLKTAMHLQERAGQLGFLAAVAQDKDQEGTRSAVGRPGVASASH